MPELVCSDFGLETAWLDDEPETIADAVSYLEKRQFVVHVSTSVEKLETWVLNNGYDAVLVDLYMPEQERNGVDLIRELRGASKHIPIIPVSHYLRDYKRDLRKLECRECVDKQQFEEENGLERLRTLLLEQCNGGRIRVIERVYGFVEKETDTSVVVRAKLPDGKVTSTTIEKDTIQRLGFGEPSGFLEITTVERRRGDAVAFQTLMRWLHGPEDAQGES